VTWSQDNRVMEVCISSSDLSMFEVSPNNRIVIRRRRVTCRRLRMALDESSSYPGLAKVFCHTEMFNLVISSLGFIESFVN
jgi:hypothetical protein